MTNGKQVEEGLTGGESKGYPWSVILDADGKALINADGPEGNIGCPVHPDERAHFMKMIEATRKQLSDEEVAGIAAELGKFADKYLQGSGR